MQKSTLFIIAGVALVGIVGYMFYRNSQAQTVTVPAGTGGYTNQGGGWQSALFGNLSDIIASGTTGTADIIRAVKDDHAVDNEN